MLIGEISKKTELSRDTIRFYEKRGLIKVESSVSEFNNYKEYTEDTLRRLLLIKKTKRFGFTLNEISELLELVDLNKASCSIFKEKVIHKIADIDKRIQELEDIKALIFKGILDAQNNCTTIHENENCQVIQSK